MTGSKYQPKGYILWKEHRKDFLGSVGYAWGITHPEIVSAHLSVLDRQYQRAVLEARIGRHIAPSNRKGN